MELWLKVDLEVELLLAAPRIFVIVFGLLYAPNAGLFIFGVIR